MRPLNRIVLVAAAFAAAAFMASPASAQATRTWISGVGDDANPCSRTAPCKTFPGAITKTAAGGEIDCLDPGGFGGVTITKSITIDCASGPGGMVGSILVAGTNGITVFAQSTDLVKIRNLSINGIQKSGSGGLNGIKFNTGAGLIVEHVGIYGFGASSGASGGTYAAVDFEPTVAAKLNMLDVDCQFGNGDGVMIKPTSTGSATATLDRVSCMQNLGSGLRVDNVNLSSGNGTNVTVFDSNMSGNAGGIIDSAVNVVSNVEVTDSVLSQNTGAGLAASGAKATIVIGGSTVTGNPIGLAAGSSATIKTFQDNYFYNGADGTVNGTPSGTVSKL